jgi:hypothetical protein
MFVFPLCDSHLCVGLSFSSALSHSLEPKNLSSSGEPLELLIQKATASKRPIVLFIEGIKTNGTGVLEFPSQVSILISASLIPPLQIFQKLSSPPTIHLCGVTYAASTSSRDVTPTSPTCPIGSHLDRFLWLSSQLSRPQLGTLSFLSSQYLPSYDSKRGMNELLINKWIEDIRINFSKLVNKKPLKLSQRDYESFSQYFHALKSGNGESAKSIADSRGK